MRKRELQNVIIRQQALNAIWNTNINAEWVIQVETVIAIVAAIVFFIMYPKALLVVMNELNRILVLGDFARAVTL